MNLRQIEVFRAVMVSGSVTDAARLLCVSQPGISRMLGHIELQLGLKLFQRIKGKLRPTPEAQTLYAQVEHVYHGVKRIEDCARELKTGGGLALRVLASPSIALELLPQAVAETMAQFPDAHVYMETQLVREIVGQLVAGDADLAISSLPVDHPHAAMQTLGPVVFVLRLPCGPPFLKTPIAQPARHPERTPDRLQPGHAARQSAGAMVGRGPLAHRLQNRSQVGPSGLRPGRHRGRHRRGGLLDGARLGTSGTGFSAHHPGTDLQRL
jgi:DNA-binding transcriptional LysR family regulator